MSLLHPKNAGTPPLPRASGASPTTRAQQRRHRQRSLHVVDLGQAPGRVRAALRASCPLPSQRLHWPTHAPQCCPTRPTAQISWIRRLASWRGASVWPRVDPNKLIGRWRLRLRRPRHPSQASGPAANHKLALLFQPHAGHRSNIQCPITRGASGRAIVTWCSCRQRPTYILQSPMHPLCRALVTE